MAKDPPDIIPAKDLSFFEFANELGGRPPLRRILSLVELGEKCKTVVRESVEWSKACSEKENCKLRFKSCQDYIKNLPKYRYKFHRKDCHKIGFFSTEFKTPAELANQKDGDLLGYCIVQMDKFVDDKGEEQCRSYVTESIVRSTPFSYREGCYILGGYYKGLITFHHHPFQIFGNYFCQQNGITNSCANAAIKMAIRENYPDTTCENILKMIGNFVHGERQACRGLNTAEIRSAIESISRKELSTYVLDPGELNSPLDFLNAIYSALESRFPVILLFKFVQEGDAAPTGHAITIIGHTFNEHSWACGSKNYFSSAIDTCKYFPSFLWCDNYIIQDDNLGPYYFLWSRFLTDSVGMQKVISSVEDIMVPIAPFSTNNFCRDRKPYAIVVHPSNMPFSRDSVIIEKWAITKLNRYTEQLKNLEMEMKDQGFSLTRQFSDFYFQYQQSGALILRTFLSSKKTYLSFLKENGLLRDETATFDKELPDSFWITEISIPELFWIFKEKVGEIITDPVLFSNEDKRETSSRFIRLPNTAGLFVEDGWRPVLFDQDKVHHPLMSPTNNFEG